MFIIFLFVFLAKLKQYYEELVKQLEISRNASISEQEFQEAVKKLEERHNKVLEKRKSWSTYSKINKYFNHSKDVGS